jgi:hypothetical protein
MKSRNCVVSMVEILSTHVCKWKNENCWNDSSHGGRGIKESDGGGDVLPSITIIKIKKTILNSCMKDDSKVFNDSWRCVCMFFCVDY